MSAKVKAIILYGKLKDEERELLNIPIDDLTTDAVIKIQKMFRKRPSVGSATVDHITNVLQSALKIANREQVKNNNHNNDPHLDELFCLNKAIEILHRYEGDDINSATAAIERVAGIISLKQIKS